MTEYRFEPINVDTILETIKKLDDALEKRQFAFAVLKAKYPVLEDFWFEIIESPMAPEGNIIIHTDSYTKHQTIFYRGK